MRQCVLMMKDGKVTHVLARQPPWVDPNYALRYVEEMNRAWHVDDRRFFAVPESELPLFGLEPLP